MAENQTMEGQGDKVAAARENNTKETKRPERKTQAQTVCEFLGSIGTYEADAIRIGLAFGNGSMTAETLTAEDKLCVNRFLNLGLKREDVNGTRIITHRTNRAVRLAETLAKYTDKDKLVIASGALTRFAVSEADVEEARKALQSRPQ